MNVIRMLHCLLFLVSAPSIAGAYTLTFDDIAAGQNPGGVYVQAYGVSMPGDFVALDHSDSTWGHPLSGSNVLGINKLGGGWGALKFSYGNSEDEYSVQTLSGYFSTQEGVQVRIIGYSWITSSEVANVVIGEPGQAWENIYVEIPMLGDGAGIVEFRGLNSPADMLSFCVDDLTIIPVPEPSSLAVLAGGIAGFGGLALKRRKS